MQGSAALPTAPCQIFHVIRYTGPLMAHVTPSARLEHTKQPETVLPLSQDLEQQNNSLIVLPA